MNSIGIIAVTLCLGGLSYSVVNLRSQNIALRDQLQVATGYRAQLQEQVELNTRQRLNFEDRVDSTQKQLLGSENQLSALTDALAEARAKIDPNYEELLQRAKMELAAQSPQPGRRSVASAFGGFSDPDTARSRAANTMPNMYGNYLDALDISAANRQIIMDAIVEFGSERYQMLGELLAGNLSRDQAVSLFGAEGLASSLGELLSEQQLDDLIQYDALVKQDSARHVYGENLGRTGSAISGALQNQVLDVVLDEVFSADSNFGALVASDGSMLTAHYDQLAAFERARDRLQNDLNAEQLAQFDSFVANRSNGVDVILEASTDGNGRIAIRNARVSLQDLPQ